MRLFTLQFSSHLQAFLCHSSLATLDDDKLLEWNAANQLPHIATARSFVLALLSREVFQLLYIELPGVEPPRLTELGEERTLYALQRHLLTPSFL